MAEVTDQEPVAAEPPKSPFHQYLIENPEMGNELARILVNLYHDPPKGSEVQQRVKELLAIEPMDASLIPQLKQENKALQHEIFDHYDEIIALEKEVEEMKEE